MMHHVLYTYIFPKKLQTSGASCTPRNSGAFRVLLTGTLFPNLHGGPAPTTQGSGEALFQALATSCTIAPVNWTHLSTEIYVSTAKILVYAVSLCLRNPDPSLSLFWPLYYLHDIYNRMYILYAHIFDPCFKFSFAKFRSVVSASHPPAMCSSRLTALLESRSYYQPKHYTGSSDHIFAVFDSPSLGNYDWDLPEFQAPKFPQMHISWGIFFAHHFSKRPSENLYI